MYTKTTCSKNIEFYLVVSVVITLSRKGITKALIRLYECAGWYVTLLYWNAWAHPEVGGGGGGHGVRTSPENHKGCRFP